MLNKRWSLKGKIALVTGAGTGIGAGVALALGAAGAHVIVHYRSHGEQAEAIAETLRQSGTQALALQADVADAVQVAHLFEQIAQQAGVVDIVVNNAGVYPSTPLLEMTPEQWDQTIAVNLRSVFLCTQAAARQMVAAQRGGAIINITSIEAFNPAPGHCHYSASKAAVAMFTQNAALELGHYGIRVNSVAPGLINSPTLPQDWPDGVQRWNARVPLERLGEPQDIADACLYLASEAARWVSGAQLVVDGGMLSQQVF